MQKELFVCAFLAVVAFAVAIPMVVEDTEGQQYYLTPALNRQRRSGPGFGAAGGGTRHGQGGFAGVNNPNGSGGGVSYSHQNGYGHNVAVDGRVPVWSSKNRYGESTVNLGAGTSQHLGRGGEHNLDKRVGVSFNHQF